MLTSVRMPRPFLPVVPLLAISMLGVRASRATQSHATTAATAARRSQTCPCSCTDAETNRTYTSPPIICPSGKCGPCNCLAPTGPKASCRHRRREARPKAAR